MADISKIVLPDTSEYNVKDAGAARHNEAICLARAHNGDGILDGCEMEITGTTLEISSGSVLAGGKVAYFPTGEEVALGGISITDGFVQVILNIQLSHSPQVWITLEESPTTTFDPLIQNDLNIAGNLYQYELCKVEVVSGALSIYSTSLPSNLVTAGEVRSNRAKIISDGVTLPRYDIVGDDGVNYAAFRTTAHNNGDARIYGLDSNGVATAGAFMEQAGRLILFGHENDIVIRPNGASSTSGQVYFDTNGHQHGGHGVAYHGDTTSKTCSSTSFVDLYSYSTGIDTSLDYLIVAQCNFVPASASASVTNFRIELHKNGSWSGLRAFEHFTNSTGTHYWTQAYLAPKGFDGVLIQWAKGTVNLSSSSYGIWLCPLG